MHKHKLLTLAHDTDLDHLWIYCMDLMDLCTGNCLSTQPWLPVAIPLAIAQIIIKSSPLCY